MAGLNCARLLHEAGFSVTLFDKGRFPTGRLASRTRDEDQFDYGAQYFTVESDSFRAFIEPLIKSGSIAEWKGNFGTINNTIDKKAVKRKVSPRLRFVGVPSMNSLYQCFEQDEISLFTRHRVERIERNQYQSWSLVGRDLTGESGKSFRETGFEFLILNMPPLQAQMLFPDYDLSGIKMEPCFALLVGFDERLNVNLDGIFFEDELLSWAARDSSKPGRPAGERWVIHSSSKWSSIHMEEDLDIIADQLLARFAMLVDENSSLPEIKFRKCHRWRYARPYAESDLGSIFLAEEGLGFCGDWCLAPRVEGAFLSGESLAKRVIAEAGADCERS